MGPWSGSTAAARANAAEHQIGLPRSIAPAETVVAEQRVERRGGAGARARADERAVPERIPHGSDRLRCGHVCRQSEDERRNPGLNDATHESS